MSEGQRKRRLKAMLMEREAGHCFWCDRHVGARPTLDHIIPVSKGGTFAQSNVVLACYRCNNWRGNLGAKQFAIIMWARP